MKILLTGGGTGGHFYPLIAVAEKIREISDREKILDVKLFYMSDAPYDKEALFENQITYIATISGKQRLYASARNFFDLFKIALGSFHALIRLFFLYPDAVFGKGGYASFPALFAARILGIPVIIHESDSVPGRVNKWAGKFAKKIGVSWEEAAKYFPKDRVAVVGQPIRKTIAEPAREGAFEYLKLDPSIPVIFVLGGSQGSETINNIVVDALPELVKKYQVIHQTGAKNIDAVRARAGVVLVSDEEKKRYKPFGYLNPLSMKMSAGAAKIVISRGGSQIFEIASWGAPSIIVPIPPKISRDQEHNAFNYARVGAASVIEESNLTPYMLVAEADRIMAGKWEEMHKNALAFANRTNAAETIAQALLEIGLGHEK